MRYRVYSNILTSIADGSKKQAELGDARKVLDYINELESVFKEEINIGGSKVQADIVPPDWLNDEFSINISEVDFTASKPEESKNNSSESEAKQSKTNPTDVHSSNLPDKPQVNAKDEEGLEESYE